MTDEKKPPEPEQEGSEVARLLEIIRLEYEAAQQGLQGLAYGTSQHRFITERMEGMEIAREHLVNIIGDENEANKLVMDQLDLAGGKTEKLEEEQE